MNKFKGLMDKGDKEGAMRLIDEMYDDDPDSAEASYNFAHMMLEADHPGPARALCTALSEKYPEKWQTWQHLGKCYEEFEELDKAEAAWKKALEMKPDAHAMIIGLSNIYTQQNKWELAREYALKALSMGESLQSEINLAFTCLAEHDYGMGWDLYSKGIGHMRWRSKHDYGLQEWDGGPGKVLFYGEQGIGDQIAFCSALPDAIADGTAVALNCYPKLGKLFAENFDIKVYGDQFAEECHWIQETGATHQASISLLPKHYRRTPESFPGTPFLKANPDKVLQWRALLDKHCSGLKVGISWTGGKRKSHAWKRKGMEIEHLKNLLTIDGVDWICLEYKDRSAELSRIRTEDGLIIRDWPWGTQTDDYGDTAALIENLDCLITVPTSVNHLAGAMGKEVHCMIHDKPHFHYSTGMPYYNSVHLHQRDEQGKAEVYSAIMNLLEKKKAA